MSTFPPVCGHRGAAAAAPENTLASIREAARQGAAWVEVDVMLTADGVPVLIHDETLDRSTDGQGAVAETPYAALAGLDAGSWFAPSFAGERVPTLEAALSLILELGLGLDLEIKPSPGREEETARAAIDCLARRWPAGWEPAGRGPLLVSSFRPACLAVARALAPQIPRGLLLGREPAGWAALADELQVATVIVDHSVETERSIADYRASGRPVLAYTVNEPERARALFAWGLAGVISDAPGRIASACPGAGAVT